MKILVTGAGGFLGRWVIKYLREGGHEVDGIDLDGFDMNLGLTALTEVINVTERTEPEVIIQLAALAGAAGKGGGIESLKTPYQFLSVNPSIVLNIYEACRVSGIKKVICISSFSPYGKAPCPINEETRLNPNNPYGASKANVETIAKVYSECYGIKSIIFRVPLICGEGQKEMNALREFVHSVLKHETIKIWGNGGALREFVHPLDVARAFQLALSHFQEMRTPWEVFVLGNEPVSMLELAELVISKAGRGSFELLTDKPRLFDQYTDRKKVELKLGWVPTVSIGEIVDRVLKEAKA